MASYRRTTALVALLAVGAIGGASALLAWRAESVAILGPEGYKAALQFVLVVILGGLISLVYQAFNREADRRLRVRNEVDEHRRALRRQRQSFTSAFIDDYNATKKIRRLLRAQATETVPNEAVLVRVEEYDKLMSELIETQLRLETIHYTLRSDIGLFPDPEKIIENVTEMERYLATLITEYEKVLPRTARGSITVDISHLPALGRFIGPYRSASEYQRYVRAFHQTANELQAATVAHIQDST